MLEIFQYPGFNEDQVTPLPFNVSLDAQVMRRVLPQRYTLSKQVCSTYMYEEKMSFLLKHLGTLYQIINSTLLLYANQSLNFGKFDHAANVIDYTVYKIEATKFY